MAVAVSTKGIENLVIQVFSYLFSYFFITTQIKIYYISHCIVSPIFMGSYYTARLITKVLLSLIQFRASHLQGNELPRQHFLYF